MPISPMDEYLAHQTPETFDQVFTSDRNFYDRYYFNMHASSDELFLVTGMGQYPNLGVTDAFVSISHGDTLYVVRASRELGGDRLDTRVGPYLLPSPFVSNGLMASLRDSLPSREVSTTFKVNGLAEELKATLQRIADDVLAGVEAGAGPPGVLAGRLHRLDERAVGVARRGPCLLLEELDTRRRDRAVLRQRGKILVISHRLDGAPARLREPT